jgi:hypothetical protein
MVGSATYAMIAASLRGGYRRRSGIRNGQIHRWRLARARAWVPAQAAIVAAGTPEDVARAPGSVTGPWLAEYLGLPEARQPDVLSHG